MKTSSVDAISNSTFVVSILTARETCLNTAGTGRILYCKPLTCGRGLRQTFELLLSEPAPAVHIENHNILCTLRHSWKLDPVIYETTLWDRFMFFLL